MRGYMGKQTGVGYDAGKDLGKALLAAMGPREKKKGQENMGRLMPSNLHFITEHDTPKYCKLCYDTLNGKKANVHTCCDVCDYAFHVDCFRAWHTDVTPVSTHAFREGPPPKKKRK